MANHLLYLWNFLFGMGGGAESDGAPHPLESVSSCIARNAVGFGSQRSSGAKIVLSSRISRTSEAEVVRQAGLLLFFWIVSFDQRQEESQIEKDRGVV